MLCCRALSEVCVLYVVVDNEGCKFFTAIVRFAKFANLTYHRELLHFAVKCHTNLTPR